MICPNRRMKETHKAVLIKWIKKMLNGRRSHDDVIEVNFFVELMKLKPTVTSWRLGDGGNPKRHQHQSPDR